MKLLQIKQQFYSCSIAGPPTTGWNNIQYLPIITIKTSKIHFRHKVIANQILINMGKYQSAQQQACCLHGLDWRSSQGGHLEAQEFTLNTPKNR